MMTSLIRSTAFLSSFGRTDVEQSFCTRQAAADRRFLTPPGCIGQTPWNITNRGDSAAEFRPDAVPVRKCYHVRAFRLNPGWLLNARPREVAWARLSIPEPAFVSEELCTLCSAKAQLSTDAGASLLRIKPSVIKGTGSPCSVSPVLLTHLPLLPLFRLFFILSLSLSLLLHISTLTS